jgi:hypothetical protein
MGMLRIASMLAAVLLVTLAGCNPFGPGDWARRSLEVEHYLEECMGPWHQLCLLVRQPGTGELHRHYGGIEGFEFEWGYTYRIDVTDRRIRNPPADGSSIRTIIHRVVSRERVQAGTEFEIFITSDPLWLVEISPDIYRFYDSAEFRCPPSAGCAELRARIAEGARIEYRLRHPAVVSAPLSLVQWRTCSAQLAGSRSCNAGSSP